MTKTATKKKGDTIRYKMKDGSIQDLLIEKIKTIEVRSKGKNGKPKTQTRIWATVFMPTVLHIGKCYHDILQRCELNLDIYKEPKAEKKGAKKKRTKKSITNRKPKPALRESLEG